MITYRSRSPWDSFWYKTSSGWPEALFRTAFCTVLLCDVLGLTSKVSLLFSNQGVHPATPIDFLYPEQAVLVLHRMWILVLISLILGFRTRLTAWINFALTTYFFSLRGYSALHVADWVHQSMSFYLALMTTDRHLTIEKFWRSPKAGTALPSVWPLRLAQLNLASIYFHSATTKLIDPGWLQGTAFLDTLRSPYLTNFAMPWLPSYAAVFIFLNYAVIAWEFSIPFFWISRKTRFWAVLSSYFFHFGILLLLRVGWFTEVMLAALFLFADDWPILRNKGFPDDPAPGYLGDSLKKLGVTAFLCFHLTAFALVQTAYMGRTFAPNATWWRQYQSLPPVLILYNNLLIRLVYFNVWPSAVLVSPHEIVQYRSYHPDGSPAGLFPYDASGKFVGGIRFLKEARWGLLRIRMAKFGMQKDHWIPFLDHLVHQHQKQYHQECPKALELRTDQIILFHGKNLSEPYIQTRIPLLKADVSCSDQKISYDIQWSPDARPLNKDQEDLWYDPGNILDWLKGLNAYNRIGV